MEFKRAGKMKKTFLLVMFLLFCGSVIMAETINEFTVKAKAAQIKIAKKETVHTRLKIRYEYIAGKINILKKEKAAGGIRGAISAMKLDYYLNSGNRTGYKLYALENEIQELKDERFTYIMIIMDEYTKKLKECFKTKCAGIGALYVEREKWMASLEDYRDMLKMDFDLRGMIGALNEQAKDDLKKYVEIKLEQADERIYLLKEEKEISKEVLAAGIKIDKKTVADIDKDMAYMEMMKKKMLEVLGRR
jgi:hypothetical protein